MAEDLALLLEARDRPAEIRERCEARLAHPAPTSAHDAITLGLALGWACYVQGNTDRAWEAIERVRERQSDRAFTQALAIEFVRLEAGVLATQGRSDEAELRLNEAIERYQGQSRGRLFGILGRLLEGRGDLQGSLNAINSGLDDARLRGDDSSTCALIETDQLKSEQARIKKEKTAATRAINAISGTRDDILTKLDQLLEELRTCGDVYKHGGYNTRRKITAGLMEAIYIRDEEIIAADLSGVIATLHNKKPSTPSNKKSMASQAPTTTTSTRPTKHYSKKQTTTILLC